MAVSRDSVAILHMIWERDCYQAIDNLVNTGNTKVQHTALNKKIINVAASTRFQNFG